MKKQLSDRWKGYTVEDCDCRYCLYFGGAKYGEAFCLASRCVCREERSEALRLERMEKRGINASGG